MAAQEQQPVLVDPMPTPVERLGLTAPQALNMAAIIMLALYFGRELLVPLALAVLLAFVLAPAVTLLKRLRMGHAPAVIIAVALAFAVIGAIGAVVVSQAGSLAQQLPRYQATMQEKVQSFSSGSEAIERLVASARRMLSGGSAGTAEVEVRPAPATEIEAPSTLVVIRTVLSPLLGPLATAGVVIVFVFFVLLYRGDLRDRLVRLVGRRDLHRTILAMNEAARRLSRLFVMQLALNAAFGTYVAAGLWATGLPNPLLWGLLAAISRFVPFIGGVIALVPPLLLALAVAPGWSLALIVLAVILGGELVMGQVVEPLSFGHSTGLSPIAVILSAMFWAFLWGPIGLLLATPLTVCLVVVGRHVPALSFVHVTLSDESPLTPPETFYQRALEGNAADLLAQARAETARTSATEFFDHVAISALALAQSDLSRDALAFERLEAVHDLIESMLAQLAAPDRTAATRTGGAAGTAPAAIPNDWRAPGAVLFIPGRGQLDDLAATMAVQALQARGFGAGVLPNAALGGEIAGAEQVRLCCISVLEQGSSAASIRLFLRRIQRRMPHAAAVVCLWHAVTGSPTLATLRAEGEDEYIVLSLSELAALAVAVAARGQKRGPAPRAAADARMGS